MSGTPGQAALAEIAFCEQVLAKGGATVLTETLRGVGQPESWTSYPEGEVFDPQSGAQWFYHSHHPAADEAEHGHFHCFVRPDGADGPIHHLCAVGVDPHGRLVRLFTVNQWVVGDDWLAAEPTVSLLPRFDVHMPQPNYLVNRWLTAVVAAHEPTIAGLIRARDAAIARHAPDADGDARASRALEVTAEHRFTDASAR
ncbi:MULTISPECIES: hypothetical protein [unclassified Roseitalea]|uniref:DUF6969 family protein n=1 Tax=unclassified Roseitalea TaxID=2639107 RepID=UPI00273D270A|nr:MULTISPECIES: hypothetical protein [unclassified Roseitalea]